MSPSQRQPTRPTNAARIMNLARVLWCFLVSLKTSEIAKIAAIAEGTQWRRLKTIGTCGTLSLIKIWGEVLWRVLSSALYTPCQAQHDETFLVDRLGCRLNKEGSIIWHRMASLVEMIAYW